MSSLPLPPEVYELLREWAASGRSGQLTLEYRSGQCVAYSKQEKVRLEGPQVTNGLEHKALR